MAAISSTTLLEEINQVLLSVNETTVRTRNENFVAQKAENAINEGIRALVAASSNWDWLRQVVTAATWSNEKATLDSSVLEVMYVMCNRMVITYLRPDKFNATTTAPSAYTGDTNRPKWYTRIGTNEFYFNPYPSEVVGQDSVKFYVTKFPTVPSNDTGTYGIPDQFMPLIRNYASHLLALNHVNNPEMARNYKSNWERGVKEYRAKYINTQNWDRTVIAT